MDRLIAAGATCVDIGQGDVRWVVLGDPCGNEFCVMPKVIRRSRNPSTTSTGSRWFHRRPGDHH